MTEANIESSLEAPATASSVITTRSAWDYLRRYGCEVGLVLVVVLGAVAYLGMLSPKFRSWAKLYVEPNRLAVVSGSSDSTAVQENFINTQSQLLQSRTVISRALDKPGIRKLWVLGEQKDPVRFLQKNLDVQTSSKHSLITVSLATPKPADAALIVNAVVDTYVNYRESHQHSTAADVLKILEKEKSARDRELAAAHQEMVAFKQSHKLVALEGERGNIILQRLGRLSETLASAQLSAIQANANLRAAESLAASPSGQRRLASEFNPSATGGKYTETLNQMQLQLASLQRQLTDQHPTVQGLKAQIAQVQAQADQQVQEDARAGLADLRQARELALKTQQEIQNSLDQQQKVAEAYNVQASELAMIQSKIGRAERLSEILDSRVREMNLTQDTGNVSVPVLEYARAATVADYSNTAPALAASVLVGLLAAAGFRYLRRRVDGRMISVADMAWRLPLPLLAAISKEDSTNAGPKTSSVSATCRSLSAGLQFALGARQAKVVMVTSPAAGEGKSHLASSLAKAFAYRGVRTVLVDAAVGGAVQHELLSVSNRHGLSNVLAGNVALSLAVQPTKIANLSVLTSGPTAARPEDLASSAFADLVDSLASEYDQVILDSSSVLDSPDTQIACSTCDAVILAVRRNHTTRGAVQRSAAALGNVGARVIGVVATFCKSGEDSSTYSDFGQLSWSALPQRKRASRVKAS